MLLSKQDYTANLCFVKYCICLYNAVLIKSNNIASKYHMITTPIT